MSIGSRSGQRLRCASNSTGHRTHDCTGANTSSSDHRDSEPIGSSVGETVEGVGRCGASRRSGENSEVGRIGSHTRSGTRGAQLNPVTKNCQSTENQRRIPIECRRTIASNSRKSADNISNRKWSCRHCCCRAYSAGSNGRNPEGVGRSVDQTTDRIGSQR